MLLEQVDAAFHGVALLVCVLVERGRSSTAGAAFAPVGGLVVLDRDDTSDPAAAKVGPVALRAVCLVTQDSVRAGAGPATVGSGHPDAVQDGGELWAVPTLPGGDQDGQRFAALLTSQVQLRGQATPRPAQRVIGRFDAANAAGWFLL